MILTAKQNQKFPFHFFFRFAVEGWGEETRGKMQGNFWFLLPRPQGADEARRLERTIQFQATTRSARAISSFRQGSARNAVELCSIHTAKIRNQKKRTKRDRACGATPFRLPIPIFNFGGICLKISEQNWLGPACLETSAGSGGRNSPHTPFPPASP